MSLMLHKFFQLGYRIITLHRVIIFLQQKYVCNSIDVHRFDEYFYFMKEKNSGNCFDPIQVYTFFTQNRRIGFVFTE